MFYPLEIKGAIQKDALLDLLMKAFRTGLIGSIISTFGGSCGILWDSAYMAYGIPFVSFYFGIILHDRYFKNQIWFYPVEWILADENWGPDKIGVLAISTVVFISNAGNSGRCFIWKIGRNLKGHLIWPVIRKE